MAKNFTKKYEINYYEVDSRLKCKLSSIANFLCDVGTNQSEVLGDTIEKLIEKDYAWVFYKYDIKMYNYPHYRDIISVTTEPIGFNRFYAHRKYYIKNQEGETIGEAIALFFLINLKRRRPMRIPEEEYTLYGLNPDSKKDVKMDDIKSSEDYDYDKEFTIRYSDIDSNGHVNNVNYIEWAIESVPIDVVKEYEVKRVKIVFEKETTYGEKVKISTKVLNEDDSISTIHTITNSQGKELTKLEINWDRE